MARQFSDHATRRRSVGTQRARRLRFVAPKASAFCKHATSSVATGCTAWFASRLDIPFEGGSYQEAFVLADVHMEWPLSREEVTLFYSPAGLMVVAPIPEERYRVVATVRKAPAVPTIADVQALLDTRGPAIAPGRVRDIVWSSRFHIHHRLAQTFHDRCVLVVGDAAHVHSPAGGQGMNTGIQDAISLGNALASAFGAGNAQSLVNWAHDRRRVARRVVRLTDRMTRAATIGNKTGQIVRNTIVELAGHVPAIRRAIAMRLSELSERAA